MKTQFNNKIFVFDNVLSMDECNMLIQHYDDKGPTHKWNDTFPMGVDYHDSPEGIINCFLKIQKIVSENFDTSIGIDWCEIVKWPIGSTMNTHKDIASDNTIFTSITYLNEDYSGGQTYILNDITFVPKIGRTVCFDGNFYEHGVSEVTSGCRYTAPIWYMPL